MVSRGAMNSSKMASEIDKAIKGVKKEMEKFVGVKIKETGMKLSTPQTKLIQDMFKFPLESQEARIKSLEMGSILMKSTFRSHTDTLADLQKEFVTVKQEFETVKSRFELGMSAVEGGIKRSYKIANEQK